MTTKYFGVATVLLAACVVSLHGASIPDGQTVTLSSSEAKQLERSAHTLAEFTQLASYFEMQGKEYSEKGRGRKAGMGAPEPKHFGRQSEVSPTG